MEKYFDNLLNPVKAPHIYSRDTIAFWKVKVFILTEVAAAIPGLKFRKDACEYEIQPKSEMLKALNGKGVSWLTRVCEVALQLGKTPKVRQIDVTIPIYKKGDRKECINYRGISLFSLPRKVHVKCPEMKRREIVESKLEDDQCGFFQVAAPWT